MPTNISKAETSSTKPVEIGTAAALSDYVTAYSVLNVSDNIVLTDDIDMKDHTLTGTIGTAANPFCGTFDGCGFTIKNLSVSIAETETKTIQNAGLFGVVSGKVSDGTMIKARIKNVGLGGEINLSTSNCISANVGVLVGNASNVVFEHIQITGKIKYEPAFDYSVNFGTLAGYAEDCQVSKVICRTTGFGEFEIATEDNKNFAFGGVVGEASNVNISFAVVGAAFNTNFDSAFAGNAYIGGVVGKVYQGGSQISNVAVENKYSITKPEGSSVYVGEVAGVVSNEPPEAGNISYVHYKVNAGVGTFGDNGSYEVSSSLYLTSSLYSLSSLEHDSAGNYLYFTEQEWNRSLEVWDFSKTWYVASQTIYLQSFYDNFAVNFPSLNTKVIQIDDTKTTLKSGYKYGDEVKIAFKFVEVVDGENVINMQDYYTLTAIELPSSDVKIVTLEENGVVSYRVSGSDLFEIKANEDGSAGFELTIKNVNLATSGNYNIKVSPKTFKINFSTKLYDNGVLQDKVPAYIYSGTNTTTEYLNLTRLSYDQYYKIETSVKSSNDAIAPVGWFMLKDGQEIDLQIDGSYPLEMTFGHGYFTGDCEVYVKYTTDACNVLFKLGEGISQIVCGGNVVEETIESGGVPVPKQAQKLKLDIYVKLGYSFDVQQFITEMDVYKGNNPNETFCTLQSSYETDEYQFFQFFLNIDSLQDDYKNTFTINAKTTALDEENNSWIWWVGGVGGAIILAVIIILIVVLKRRRGYGGRSAKSSYNKKNFKNMYF
ncbi:MAG: hypothetical protein J6K39_02335 [Clostridia bacterium]|nr:hypothetical protein [Clostridia bacterium]